MKKTITFIMMGIMSLSIVACGNNTISLEEVEKAIADGTITVEDAFERGYIDEKWVTEYQVEKEVLAVPAADKRTSNMIDAFQTITLDGQSFTNSDLNPVTYFAFINPNSEEGKSAYNVIIENYEKIVDGKANVLIVNTLNDDNVLFEDSKFPVVQYNESMKNALGSLTDMVKEDTYSGAWNGNGAFLSSWNSKLESKSFLNSMTGIVDMVMQGDTDEENTRDNTIVVPMG